MPAIHQPISLTLKQVLITRIAICRLTSVRAAAVSLALLFNFLRVDAQNVPLAPPTTVAQNGFPGQINGVVDRRTLMLLRRIKRAEQVLTLTGEQVTVLYAERGRPPEQSEQTIYFASALGYRCEYHQPNRLVGEVIVSRADGYWHSIPKRHLLVVGTPRPRHIGVLIGPALRAIRSGQAQAIVTGSDTVAGRAAEVIVISAISSPPRPTARLWIDLATGAQLRTELYDAQGGLRSVSYFTQIDYAPSFQPGVFDPPAVPAGTTTVMQQPPIKLDRLPTDAEAGFHILIPTAVPPGYTFESASIFHYAAARNEGVTLRYRNSVSTLSLFERMVKPGDRTQAFGTASPRAGTVIVHRPAMELVAIGALSNGDLLNVLNSMH